MFSTHSMPLRLCLLILVRCFKQNSQERKLQIIQNKTVRFIKNLGPRTHIAFSELDSLGMLNVDLRVKQLKLSYVHKISNGCCTSYSSEYFVKVSSIHNHKVEGVEKTL